MFIIYDLIFLVFMIIYFPIYLFQGKLNRGFLRRLGFLPQGVKFEKPIWIHAVSVGETIAIKGMVEELRKAYPGKQLVISCVTSTGYKVAQGLIKPGDFLTYLPLDFSFIVKKVMRLVCPCLFVVAETEIWPNLISGLFKQKVPIVTVNGRISDSSYSGYRVIKLFIRPILRKMSYFCVQTDLDAGRLKNLGVADKNIQVTGNIKFDLNLSVGNDSKVYREKLGLNSDEKLLVCGSTHPREEEQILSSYFQVLSAFPNLKLLIAPRHPQRAKEIANLVAAQGFAPVFISQISSACPTCINKPVFILDSIGELSSYYAVADVVFVGGSLVKTGGHNLLEPASFKKAIIFGPEMFNFRQIKKLFLEQKAGLMVHNVEELAQKIKDVLGNDILAKRLGQAAYDLILFNQGASQKNVSVLRQFLS